SDPAEKLLADPAPPVSPLVLLAVSRFEWSAFIDRVFVNRPNILTRHIWMSLDGDAVVVQDATDIVFNEVGVDLREADAFRLRLGQGIVDTNAEAVLEFGTPNGNAAE